MSHPFRELVIGGVLITPFVTYLALALAILLLLRPVLARIGFESVFSSPPLAMLSLFVVILAALMILF